MPRIATFAACVLVMSAGSAAASSAAAPWPDTIAYVEAQRAAVAAYQAKDTDAFLREAERALASNPGHPPARYLRAAALALAGQDDAALDELAALADLGLVQSPEREPAFAALADDARFRALLARFAANAQPLGEARVVVRARLAGDFVPEALARDRERDRILLGSVRQRRIVALDARGTARPFARGGELLSVFGMHVVGHELLVASSGFAEMRPAAPERIGDAGVHAFALASGEPRGRWLLPADGETRHAIGDLLALADGRLLLSDSLEGALYVLDRATSRFSRVPAPDTRFLGSPQGMAALDARRVAFADYTSGLWVVDLGPPAVVDPDRAHAQALQTRRGTTFRRLPADVPAALYGIDGLYAWRDCLIAIQNGTRPPRILRLRLDAAKEGVTHADVLAASLPEWDEPTLGEVDGDTFYFVANSHWPKFDEHGELPPADELSAPLIMAIDLR
jgi:hypothetical protein